MSSIPVASGLLPAPMPVAITGNSSVSTTEIPLESDAAQAKPFGNVLSDAIHEINKELQGVELRNKILEAIAAARAAAGKAPLPVNGAPSANAASQHAASSAVTPEPSILLSALAGLSLQSSPASNGQAAGNMLPPDGDAVPPEERGAMSQSGTVILPGTRESLGLSGDLLRNAFDASTGLSSGGEQHSNAQHDTDAEAETAVVLFAGLTEQAHPLPAGLLLPVALQAGEMQSSHNGDVVELPAFGPVVPGRGDAAAAGAAAAQAAIAQVRAAAALDSSSGPATVGSVLDGAGDTLANTQHARAGLEIVSESSAASAAGVAQKGGGSNVASIVGAGSMSVPVQAFGAAGNVLDLSAVGGGAPVPGTTDASQRRMPPSGAASAVAARTAAVLNVPLADTSAIAFDAAAAGAPWSGASAPLQPQSIESFRLSRLSQARDASSGVGSTLGAASSGVADAISASVDSAVRIAALQIAGVDAARAGSDDVLAADIALNSAATRTGSPYLASASHSSMSSAQNLQSPAAATSIDAPALAEIDAFTLLLEGGDGDERANDPSSPREWLRAIGSERALSSPLQQSAPAAPSGARSESQVGTLAYASALPMAATPETWAGQLGERIQWMGGRQLKTAHIELDPPELGPLQVRISSEAGGTSIHFTTHNAAVRDLVEQSLPRLRDMLESGGTQLVDVDVAQQRDGGNRDTRESEQPARWSDRASNAAEAIALDVPVAPRRSSGLVDQFV
jgi:flagellar hook-length control protein FliK